MSNVETVYCFGYPLFDGCNFKGFRVFVPSEGNFIFPSEYSSIDMVRTIKEVCHIENHVEIKIAKN